MQPFREFAENNDKQTANKRLAALDSLSENNIKVPTEISEYKNTSKFLSKEELNLSPKDFVKALFGELYTMPHKYFQYLDVLGDNRPIDEHTGYPDGYNARISIQNHTLEENYHLTLQDGDALNLMEGRLISIIQKTLIKNFLIFINKYYILQNY